ncbi:MAG TPA: T9SS type A sorting domain-containing protein, partial [Ignavibacteriaceae bacterium]|nr:T9SS type A sorting domain-containing protein [Ignavibacteriaceae bacterium]
QTMMQMGSMNNGMMTMMKPVQIVFHISQDSLNNRGLSMNQLTCRYMDNNGNWNTVSGLTINSTANTITISQSNLYSYYVIIPSSATTVETENNLLPKDYNLKQNYPNPFNPSTVIEFSLPQKAGVKLTVFNILGKKVAELVNGNYEAGNYSIRFDAQGLSSGVYFYQLKTDNFYKVKKMQLIR